MKLYRFLLLCLLLLAGIGPARAQVDCISTNRDMDADRIEDLDDRYGLLILSSYNDLVISAGNAAQKPEIKVVARPQSDGYEYQVLFAADDTHRPKVEISHRGSVYSTSLVQLLKPDFFVAYQLIDTPFPIRYDDQTQGNDVVLSETDAAVEFTTNIEHLQVKVDEHLQARLTTAPGAADKKITVTTVTFAVQRLKDISSSIESQRKAWAEREAKALANSATSDKEWDAIDRLKAQVDSLESIYARMGQIEVYTEQSNRLSITIADMTKPRMKRCYAVLPIVVKDTVVVSKFGNYVREGGRYFGQREYDNAKTAYLNALTADDAEISMKPTVEEMILQCDTCIKYERLSAGALGKIVALKKSGTATQQEVARYAQAGIEFLTVVNNYNPCAFYTVRIDKLQQMLNDFPLVMKFTCVEWLTLREGAKLDGVELWASYNKEAIPSMMLANDRKFRKSVDEHPQLYRQVGITAADGTCEVEFDRHNMPTGVFFRPTGDDKKLIKIKYLTTDELMKKSSGTFMERQYRLKLYTKTPH